MYDNGLLKNICVGVFLTLLASCSPVTDADKKAKEAEIAANKNPVAVISLDTTQYVVIGAEMKFIGHSSFDPDAKLPLSFQWNFSGAATSILESSEHNPGPLIFSEVGVVIATLVVTDKLGLKSAPATVSITVNPSEVNRAPNGKITYNIGDRLSGNGDFRIQPGTTVIFSGSATDPDNDSVDIFNWNFPDGVTTVGAAGNAAYKAIFPTVGTYIISLSVTDAAGNRDLTDAEIAVTVSDNGGNLPPDAYITGISNQQGSVISDNTSIFAGDSIDFSALATDPEGDAISYAWNFSNISASTTVGKGPIKVAFPDPGNFVVTLTVTDSLLQVDPTPAQITVTVLPKNLPPTASIKHSMGSGDIRITIGRSIVFDAVAEDPEGNAISYAWDFSGIPATSTIGSGPITVDYLIAGSFLVSLIVHDSFGNVATAPAQITVTVEPVNRPPDGSMSHQHGSGTVDGAGNILLATNATIIFSGLATDPDGDPVNLTWDFAGASAVTTTGEGPIEVTFVDAGQYLITLNATDASGNADPTPAQINVIVSDIPVNLPPNGIITHDKGNGAAGSRGDVNIYTDDSIVFMGSATEPQVTFSWDFAGVSKNTTGKGPITVNYPKIGTYLVILTVKDAMGNVDPAPAQIAVIVAQRPINLPPEGILTHNAGSKINKPGSSGNVSITVGDTIIFNGKGIDPEGKPVSYAWNFSAVIPASSQAGPISVKYPKAGTFLVRLDVTDELKLLDPSPAEIIVTVIPINQPPEGTITHDNGNGSIGSLGNINITAGSSVLFQGAATDPEGNKIDFIWSFIKQITTATAVPEQFLVNYPTAGIYIVTLTVNDSLGNVDLSPAEVIITVASQPNLPPSGILRHDQATNSGDVTIYENQIIVFNASHTDPEGDAVNYVWELPGGQVGPTVGETVKTVQYPTAGTFIAKLIVTDINNNVDPTPPEIIVTVITNQAPDGIISHDNGSGAIDSMGNISLIAGGSIVFRGDYTELDGQAVSFTWDFGVPSPTIPIGLTDPITVNYPDVGIFTVSLVVKDELGLADPTAATLVVNVRRTLPAFKNLPVLVDANIDANPATAIYNLNANDNVKVTIVTPDETWVTPMMRYNDLQLPPLIVARRTTQMTLNVRNNLTEITTVHWHGFKIPGAQDGGPDAPIAPGTLRAPYEFTLNQPAASLWFHPHAHGTTATQVYKGLAGAFVIKDAITDKLEGSNAQGIRQLPSGKYDIPLMIQDRSFGALVNGERALVYQGATGVMGSGMLGDRILVNGVQLPGLKVDTRQYRFRLYNGSNARSYDFALSNNMNFMVVATDGGLLDAPVSIDHIKLAAGERAEIVVDFRDYRIGEDIMLVSRAFNDGGMGGGMAGPNLRNGARLDIMRFDVNNQMSDDVVLYSSLPANADINTRLKVSDTTRNFKMSNAVSIPPSAGGYTINDVSYAADIINETVVSGATEIWNITNTSNMAHPFHAHAIQWQILSRGRIDNLNNPIGTPRLASGIDLGWKDTVLVQPGESIQIIGKFDPIINTGIYMYHCHILEHEDNGMMGIFEVAGGAGP